VIPGSSSTMTRLAQICSERDAAKWLKNIDAVQPHADFEELSVRRGPGP
jgi:hypothetical protein